MALHSCIHILMEVNMTHVFQRLIFHGKWVLSRYNDTIIFKHNIRGMVYGLMEFILFSLPLGP